MLNFDRQIIITTAGNHKSTTWLPQQLLWGELVEKLRTPARSPETLAQFLAMPKAQQDELKDVGGFVAGALNGTRRKSNAVAGRDIVTLDLDNIPTNGTVAALRAVDALGCAYAVYSTRKHSELGPRLRVLIPLSRTVSADEYEPIARLAAAYIGLQYCDPTTFEACRLMYWPSTSSDSQYVYTYQDRPFLHAEGMLGRYRDWRNVAEWPVVPGSAQAQQRMVDKQGDPTAKSGIVGAFCRVYDIHSAIATFIPHAYIACDDGRYTYAGGSTTGGAVVYDDGLFLYSHHATDPCSGKLVNAFDLVRLHLFTDKDDDAKPGTPTNKMPSFVAMCERAMQDQTVATQITRERYEEAMKDFGADATPIDGQPADPNWQLKLQISAQTGTPAKTTDNTVIILENDPALRGRIIYDEFSNRGQAIGPLPWNKEAGRRDWTDLDDAGLRHYIEKGYTITGKDRIYDAIAIVGYRHRVNDVKDYLERLGWDGKPRIDTLLIDYLGAADTPYTRAVTRKALVAAVARACNPGCKFDNMLILAGPQGIGKSTLFRRLGRGWFSDSLKTFEGKEASELIQGVWINEIGELEALARSEISLVKQFLSQVDDIFRQAYGRRTERFPRRCVFFGTSNGSEFLRDKTGNRRFWPIDLIQQAPTKNVFSDLTDDEIDQIWAEARMRWQLGEQLYLTGDIERAAAEAQEDHREVSAKEGPIIEFISRPVPIDWDRWDLDRRRMFWAGAMQDTPELAPRQHICALEVWCELFNGDLKTMKYGDAVEINGAIDKADGWENTRKADRFGYCGVQRGRRRVPLAIEKMEALDRGCQV